MLSARPISHWLDVHTTREFWTLFLRKPSFRNLVIVYLAAASAYVAFRNTMLIPRGGQIWTMSDWLISYDAGFVRRGLTGSLTFMLSDLFGLAPAVVAGAMQTVLYGSMTIAVLFMLSRLRMTGPLLMLSVSPLFLLMPFFYLKLAMCKEMIGFLALALVALTAFTQSRAAFWSGILIFCLSGFSHEINGFLAPAIVVAICILAAKDMVGRTEAAVAIAASVIAAVAAVVSAMVFTGQGMSAAICEAIVSRGGNPDFCGVNGAVSWLELDMAFGMRFTWEANVVSGFWPWFIAGYALSLIPFFLFKVARDDGRLTRFVLIGAVLGLVAFAPLFIVASDWGRWIAMHVFSLTMLVFMGLRLGLIEERSERIRLSHLCYGLFWAMPDYGAALSLGLLVKLWHIVLAVSALVLGIV